MKRKLFFLPLLTSMFICLFLSGQDFKKTFSNFTLLDGENLVFLGNSITHQCLYTQYVEDYIYTRYPHSRIKIHNAGVGGDVAADALERLNEDVAPYNPKYVTILIGMNDGRYTNFTDTIFNTYKKDMALLLDRIEGIGAEAILMTPTMFDLRQAMKGENWLDGQKVTKIHYNATLSFFGAWCFQEANRRGLGFINMYEPLNRTTRKHRKEDPNFTLIDDAVHPLEAGQLVMALALLEGLETDPVVSEIMVDFQDGKWITSVKNGILEDVSTDKIRFVFTANSLPWVVPEKLGDWFSSLGAGHRMSRETFRVVGLKSGNYQLKIDGLSVGTYSHLQLSTGIELQENRQTPQYQQSLRIAGLNKERNDEAVRLVRDLWVERKVKKFGIWEPDKKLSPKEFKKWEKEFKKKVNTLKNRAEKFEDEIYRVNKPIPHTYELVEYTNRPEE